MRLRDKQRLLEQAMKLQGKLYMAYYALAVVEGRAMVPMDTRGVRKLKRVYDRSVERVSRRSMGLAGRG